MRRPYTNLRLRTGPHNYLQEPETLAPDDLLSEVDDPRRFRAGKAHLGASPKVRSGNVLEDFWGLEEAKGP